MPPPAVLDRMGTVGVKQICFSFAVPLHLSGTLIKGCTRQNSSLGFAYEPLPLKIRQRYLQQTPRGPLLSSW
jgi:hypothetical protein